MMTAFLQAEVGVPQPIGVEPFVCPDPITFVPTGFRDVCGWSYFDCKLEVKPTDSGLIPFIVPHFVLFKWALSARTLGSTKHCPIDKSLFSKKSDKITSWLLDDDSWMARLLRDRLEQQLGMNDLMCFYSCLERPNVLELPPEWQNWTQGFGRHWRWQKIKKCWKLLPRECDQRLFEDWNLTKKKSGYPCPFRDRKTSGGTKISTAWLSYDEIKDEYRGGLRDFTRARYKGKIEPLPPPKEKLIPFDKVIVTGTKVKKTLGNRQMPDSLRYDWGMINGGKKDERDHTDNYVIPEHANALVAMTNPLGQDARPASMIDSMPICDLRFIASDPGKYHWAMLRKAEQIRGKSLAVPYIARQPEVVPQELLDSIEDEELSEGYFEPNDDDEYSGQGKSKYIEGTSQVIYRGSRKDPEQLKEETEQEEARWAQCRAGYEKLLLDGNAWSSLDPREDDRTDPETGVQFNISNENYCLMQWDLDFHNGDFDSKEDLAERHGFKYGKTFITKLKKIRTYAMKKTMPTTKFTPAQIADIKAHDGRVVYAHIVRGKPRWYKLDMDRFESYEEALTDLKNKTEKQAQRDRWEFDKKKRPSKDQFIQAVKGIRTALDQAFQKDAIFIADWRTPFVVAIAEGEWENADF
jgi:hypothetical protein